MHSPTPSPVGQRERWSSKLCERSSSRCNCALLSIASESHMTHPLAETSPSTRGRILAALCLLVIIGGITAQTFIADRLVVRDDGGRLGRR